MRVTKLTGQCWRNEHPSVATLTLTAFDYSFAKQIKVPSVFDKRVLSSVSFLQKSFSARHHRLTFHPDIQAVLWFDMIGPTCGQAGGTTRGSCCQAAACYHLQPDMQMQSQSVSAMSITTAHLTVHPSDKYHALSLSSLSELLCPGLKRGRISFRIKET